MRIIHEKTQERIVKLHSNSKEISKKKIAEKCGVSRSYVYKIIKENNNSTK